MPFSDSRRARRTERRALPALPLLAAVLLAGPHAARAAVFDGPGAAPVDLAPAFASADGVLVRGQIAPGDVDVFSVPVVAGEPLVLEVLDAGADPVLGVSFDGDATPERVDDDGGRGFLPALRTVVPAGAAAAAQVIVSGFGDAAFDGTHAETFAYRLVVAKPAASAAESDEDGNDATPEPLGVGGFDALAPGGAAVVRGTLATMTAGGIGDVDLYQVPFEPGRAISVSVFSEEPGFADPTVRVLPPASEAGRDDDDGPGSDASTSFETSAAVAPGSGWTVEVARFRDEPGNDRAADYALVVTETARLCDTDGDTDVDDADLAALFAARGQPAFGPADPRDLDADGLVSVQDHRACVLRCDNPDCTPPAAGGGCGLLGLEALLPVAFALGWRRRRRAARALGPALGALALAALGAAPAEAATLGLQTATPLVNAGDPLDVDLVLSGQGGALVGAYDVDVAYSAALLTFTGVSFAGALGDPAATPTEVFQAASAAGGVVDLAEASVLSALALAALQGDPLVLATLHFTALGPGLAALSLVDDAQLFVTDAAAQPISLDRPFVDLQVTVPEPGVAGLLVLGGLVAGAARRARRP